jgi:hypothetical protein
MPLTLTREMVTEKQTKWIYPRPITFDEWLSVEPRLAVLATVTHLLGRE